MLIHGVEYGFRFTVGASIKIAKLCPQGKIENMDMMLDLPTGEALEFIAKMAVAMNEGYRMHKAFSASAVSPDFEAAGPALTEELVLSLGMEELDELDMALMAMQRKDSAQTVETVPAKKKTAAKARKSG